MGNESERGWDNITEPDPQTPESLITHHDDIFPFMQGLVATTVCSPVDVIKTRIMSASTSERRLSSMTIMSQMYKMEGIRSFFKGWTPAFIRLGPQTIITFVVLEQLKTWHHALQDQQLMVAKI